MDRIKKIILVIGLAAVVLLLAVAAGGYTVLRRAVPQHAGVLSDLRLQKKSNCLP